MQNWLELNLLVDRVNAEFQILLLKKLSEKYRCVWDGSPELVALLKETLVEQVTYSSLGKTTQERIGSGDVLNWDLTAVSYVLRSLGPDISLAEKRHMDNAVAVRNYVAHHHNKMVSYEEYVERRDKLYRALKHFDVNIDSVQKEIKYKICAMSAGYSPGVVLPAESGNVEYSRGDYTKRDQGKDHCAKRVKKEKASGSRSLTSVFRDFFSLFFGP